jgi:hypothetical protein
MSYSLKVKGQSGVVASDDAVQRATNTWIYGEKF